MDCPKFRSRAWGLLWVVALLLLLPGIAAAQSAIAGVVKDTTGAVLPGVTVEASSPALIEQARSALTDARGQYKIIDLRPGIYTVTFTLPGFTVVKREGIQLESAFTASVNADLKVGAVEETLTVSGAAPVVDVQGTTRRDTLTRELLDALPTGRHYQNAAVTLPSVTLPGRFDVGGSSSMQQTDLVVYGGLGGDMRIEIDGMEVTVPQTTGSPLGLYLNEGAFQEYVFQVNAGNAESATGGVRLNQIPREGGNQFHGFFVAFFANTSLQSNNLTDEVRARGIRGPNRIDRLWDLNPSLGGPLVRNKLWFFGSARSWAYNNTYGNVRNPDGSPAHDDNRLSAYTARLTYQINEKNKVTMAHERNVRWRGHRNLELGNVSPEAAILQKCPTCYYAQAKWTSTVSSKLLIDAGYSLTHHYPPFTPQPEVEGPSATKPYGDVAHFDLITTLRSKAASGGIGAAYQDHRFLKNSFVASVSYVTGAHAFKTGVQWITGYKDNYQWAFGDIVQQYRNGAPDSVLALNTPVFTHVDMRDLGVYVQDSWTIKRLTLNPGLRWQQFLGSIPAQDSPAGRFVPARHFDKIDNIPNWKNWTPRFGAAYDLFGNGKTAIKGSIGKYMQQDNTLFQETYNPMIVSADNRTWRDLNGDDVAQENELGPSTNRAFGIRRNRNPDAEIERPYQILYNLALQHELWQGLGLTVSYNRRAYRNLIYTTNLAVPLSAYALVQIPDPRGNGQTLPVYNLDRAFFGGVNELDANSTNNTNVYNGLELLATGRLRNGAVFTGGTSTGRAILQTCDVADPNSLRFCDQAQSDVPLRTTFKFSGTYPVLYGLRLSWVLQSVAGTERAINYLVNRTILPSLVQTQVPVRLNQPGSEFNERVNQLDFSISKSFRMGKVQLKPQVDVFNATNRIPVLTMVNTYGSSLGRAVTVLDPRLVRVGVQIEF
ncbi:MAG: carboxypeptidase regulatory-like domain-containing protein [Acidobacteria bacterium]|nr:carboxypeptidase regulatory-like domain-containing protein [Acidobacteriota bacterium]